MKSLVQKIIGIGVILAILLSNIVLAATERELDEKIKAAKEQLDGIQTEKSEALTEVQNITAKISDFQAQINELDVEISDLNTQINEAQEQLNQAQEDFTKQEELLKNRLIATYEAGETTYLDVILSSKGLTEFISNYYLIQEIADNDKKLLDEIQEKKDQISNAKETLENSKNELNTSRTSKQNVQNQLSVAKKEKDRRVAQLSESEKETQAEIDQFERDKQAIRAALATSGSRSSNAVNSESAKGFIFPLPGFTRGAIGNTNYPSYAGHTGVDINQGGVNGQTIVAVKGGTVFKSLAYKNDNGYYSYGECVVIDHGNGVSTLYAHGAPGSRLVSAGQTVSQGQPIMTVGTTGNSTGPHLHFEVLINGHPVNPMPYLP